jgi:hypothetical protein
MAKVNKNTVEKHLEQLEAEELRAELLHLYSRFPNVKQYFQVELEAGSKSTVLEQYKAKIHRAYFPKTGLGKRRNSISRKLISNFKKIAAFEYDVADLLFYRVECGIEAANKASGKQMETYYSAILLSFDEGTRLMMKLGERASFDQRLQQLLEGADGMPYSFLFKLESTLKKYGA